MKVLETDRLILRWLTPDDAEFILELLNEPAWIRFIGDKGVRTLENAKNYIVTGPMKMYSQMGFGLYMAELKEGSTPIGMCGLIKRDSLEDVDIGFAFLSKYQNKGYGYESASATLRYGHEQLALKRILAITSLDNHASSRLLEKIGMDYEGTIYLDMEELKLFASI
ncbi:RimJ/RimL family protein N-acetyltransferase [Cytobacillus firmus]|uniref:RimJ/RimL family protein N-acetyltransferase n=2 Tax=Cytobacillus TaxID=2675230 RepID=A0A366K159_CYTFI|nr:MULTISPECIES: GNAT family N-acetyltransferase [Cytobacillus]RBP95424.1 RimJ/RimL family protein N-acetyltransferase [Cytobacillus firmus]TDX44265.1 RimJ/RimL family protein N-acetyltransferase [Cytobacillus oceanisediminis]